ncbi:hypothetical protein ACB035_04830 [Aeromonas sp. S12(2024)]|uniref:hypothetical protein n=1 Tax=Aeromonas sp. S12(2024) TaxID=3242885 RepID=UPI00352890E6
MSTPLHKKRTGADKAPQANTCDDQKRQNLDERDHARAGVSELLQGFDLFVEPLGEIERLEVEGQKKASGFAHHGGLSRPVTKMAITLARLNFARQEAAAGQ